LRLERRPTEAWSGIEGDGFSCPASCSGRVSPAAPGVRSGGRHGWVLSHASCLGEDLIVRKLKFLDGAVDQLENTEHDDLRAELDARFALMSGEIARLFDVLERAFKLSPAT
jgi:hypothetical protein